MIPIKRLPHNLQLSHTPTVCTPVTHNSGFSFMEIMIALTMIGLVLMSLFGLQNTIFRQVSQAHHLTQRTLVLQNLFIDHNFLNNLFTSSGAIEKRLEQPALDLKAIFTTVNANSELKNFPNIRLIKLEADNEQLVMAVHVPQLAEDEKDTDNEKIKVEHAPDAKNTSTPKTGQEH